MEIGVHVYQLGTPVEPGEEPEYESQSIFCYSGSYSKQCLSKMCGHCTHNLQVSGVLLCSDCKVCVGKNQLAICVSRLQAKGRQHHLSQSIGPAFAGSARPALPDLLRQPCQRDKRNSAVKIIQGSKFKFKFQKLTL